MDSNGYNKSLFATEDGKCYISGCEGQTVRHEVFNGAERQKSKAQGMWIAITPEIHAKLHKDRGNVWDSLQEQGQALWTLKRAFAYVQGGDTINAEDALQMAEADFLQEYGALR